MPMKAEKVSRAGYFLLAGLPAVLVWICALDGCLVASAKAETGPAGYRNVAQNPDDTQGEAESYPHATSNSEYKNMACFAARCAIDGKTANQGHGRKFPSWGPEKRKDLWWKVEFGPAVEVDKLVLWIRADFPHDKHWHSATVEFSDGSREKIKIAKTAQPQTFSFKKRTITWLKLTELVQTEPLGWCGLSEVEVWGRHLPPAHSSQNRPNFLIVIADDLTWGPRAWSTTFGTWIIGWGFGERGKGTVTPQAGNLDQTTARPRDRDRNEEKSPRRQAPAARERTGKRIGTVYE